jgi:hypothetical protein
MHTLARETTEEYGKSLQKSYQSNDHQQTKRAFRVKSILTSKIMRDGIHL